MFPKLVVEHVKTQAQLEQALSVRRQVFIEEQLVAESIERDTFDSWMAHRKDVLHVVGYLQGKPVAAGRVVLKRPDGGLPKIGRIAVLQAQRGQGFGIEIMTFIHQLSEASGACAVTLSAQSHAVSFYISLGYRPIGDVHFEADIEHQMMEYTLSS